MKTLFSVDSRSHTLSIEDQFSIAKTAGFDGIDYIAELKDLLIHPKKILEYTHKYQIPVLGLHAPLPLVIMTPTLFSKNIFNLAKYFPDCQIYNFHLSGLHYPIFGKLKNTQKLIQQAQKNNLKISFESNPITFPMQLYPKITYKPEHFAEFCKKHNLPITFDTSHIAQQGYDIVQFFKKYHECIQLIHLSDAKNSTQHLPLGKGHLPLEKLLQEMKKVSYNYPIVFEMYTFPKKSTRTNISTDIKNSLTFFHKYTQQL